MARITVEDCLRKEGNRFALIQLAAKRTKQLLQGAHAKVVDRRNKPVVLALREIADGLVRFMTPAEQAEYEIQREKQLEAAREQAERERRHSATGAHQGNGSLTKSPEYLREALMTTGPVSGDDDDDE